MVHQNQFVIINPDDPQPSVQSFGLFLKKNIVEQCCPQKETNIVKLLNQSHYDFSTYLKTHNTQTAECTINPDNSYNIPSSQFYTHYTETENGVNITKCCTRPIDKITQTPDMQTYLQAQYLKNKCLPTPITSNKGAIPLSIDKLRYNYIKGSSCGC